MKLGGETSPHLYHDWTGQWTKDMGHIKIRLDNHKVALLKDKEDQTWGHNIQTDLLN